MVSLEYNNSPIQLAARIRDRGDDLIFCIHGLGCAKENYHDVWSQKALSEYSIIALDLPGFGNSAGLDDFSYDMKELAAVCGSFLSHFPNKRVHIIGHSMGGAVGLLLADSIHERVASFINVEGNLIGQDCTVSRRKSSSSFENFKTKQLPAMIHSMAMSDEPGRRLWSVLMKKADPRALYLSARSLVQWSDSGILLKQFLELTCSKVYVYGEFNSFMKVLRMLGDLPAICISKSGHFPMNDNPDEFYYSVASFIDSIR